MQDRSDILSRALTYLVVTDDLLLDEDSLVDSEDTHSFFVSYYMPMFFDLQCLHLSNKEF